MEAYTQFFFGGEGGLASVAKWQRRKKHDDRVSTETSGQFCLCKERHGVVIYTCKITK